MTAELRSKSPAGKFVMDVYCRSLANREVGSYNGGGDEGRTGKSERGWG